MPLRRRTKRKGRNHSNISLDLKMRSKRPNCYGKNNVSETCEHGKREFSKKDYYTKSEFRQKYNYSKSEVSKKCEHSKSEFSKKHYYSKSEFSKKCHYSKSEVSKKCHYSKNDFSKKCQHSKSVFDLACHYRTASGSDAKEHIINSVYYLNPEEQETSPFLKVLNCFLLNSRLLHWCFLLYGSFILY